MRNATELIILLVLFLVNLLGIVIVVQMMGCTNHYDSAPDYCPSYSDMHRQADIYNMHPTYLVEVTEMTPSGARLDLSGELVDPVLIDDLMDRIDHCMFEQFHSGIPRDVSGPAFCTDSHPEIPDRTCVTIKIGDWSIGCSGHQVLTWEAKRGGCAAKGIEPKPGCPCRWRSGVQDGHTIVTTPNFYLFADWYIRVFWGCLQPWSHPDVAKCASQGKLYEQEKEG